METKKTLDLQEYLLNAYEYFDDLTKRLQDDYNGDAKFEQLEEDRLILCNTLGFLDEIKDEQKGFLSFKDYIDSYLEDTELEEHMDETHEDIYDLANKITYGMFANGSVTHWTPTTKLYLKHWWRECGEFIEEYEKRFGEKPNINPFEEPDRFHVAMIALGIEMKLEQIECLKDKRNFKLTKKLIKEIQKEVE